MAEILSRYGKNMTKTLLRVGWSVGILLRRFRLWWDMAKTYLWYGWDSCEIGLRYDWDIAEIGLI